MTGLGVLLALCGGVGVRYAHAVAKGDRRYTPIRAGYRSVEEPSRLRVALTRALFGAVALVGLFVAVAWGTMPG
jgi:hypothetical protein